MSIPRFFKVPQHKQFNFTPRYYDPEKEEREERIKRIREEMGIQDTNTAYKANSNYVRGQMKTYFDRTKKTRKQSNLRLLIILMFLLLIAYYFFFE
ncbi:hypothetical protein ACFLSA_00920 [Bacteroidota bacterium]